MIEHESPPGDAYDALERLYEAPGDPVTGLQEFEPFDLARAVLEGTRE